MYKFGIRRNNNDYHLYADNRYQKLESKSSSKLIERKRIWDDFELKYMLLSRIFETDEDILEKCQTIELGQKSSLSIKEGTLLENCPKILNPNKDNDEQCPSTDENQCLITDKNRKRKLYTRENDTKFLKNCPAISRSNEDIDEQCHSIKVKRKRKFYRGDKNKDVKFRDNYSTISEEVSSKRKLSTKVNAKDIKFLDYCPKIGDSDELCNEHCGSTDIKCERKLYTDKDDTNVKFSCSNENNEDLKCLENCPKIFECNEEVDEQVYSSELISEGSLSTENKQDIKFLENCLTTFNYNEDDNVDLYPTEENHISKLSTREDNYTYIKFLEQFIEKTLCSNLKYLILCRMEQQILKYKYYNYWHEECKKEIRRLRMYLLKQEVESYLNLCIHYTLNLNLTRYLPLLENSSLKKIFYQRFHCTDSILSNYLQKILQEEWNQISAVVPLECLISYTLKVIKVDYAKLKK